MVTYISLFLGLVLLACPISVSAGMVHTEPLRESLKGVQVILIAEVLEAPSEPVKPTKDSALLWIYRMRVAEVLVGTVGREEFAMQFAEKDYSSMATDGRLMFSPIAKGSGLEKSLRVGEKYILICPRSYDFEQSNDRPATLIRAEPIIRRQEVLSILQELSSQ